MKKNNTSDTINQLLRQTNYYRSKPDIANLANDLGFNIYMDDILNNNNLYDIVNNQYPYGCFIRGLLVSDTKEDIMLNNKIILVEENQDLEYRRFTIAYLLTKYIGSDNTERFTQFVIDNNYDKETLLLVRDLLIPDYSYKKLDNQNNLNKVKNYYDVPDFVAASKIKKIGGRK